MKNRYIQFDYLYIIFYSILFKIHPPLTLNYSMGYFIYSIFYIAGVP